MGLNVSTFCWAGLAIMDHVNCNLCGSNDSKLLFYGVDLCHRAEEKFALVRCTECDLVYVNPRPAAERMGEYYPPWHHQRVPARPIEETTIWGIPFDEAMAIKSRLIRKWSSPGRLLDVGCGDGCLLYYLKQRGWQTEGVEFGDVIYGRETLGLSIFQGVVEDAPLEEKSFDVVSLFHALEHLPDPRGTLAHLFSLLKPGGRLVLEVPNFGSLDAALFGPHWVGVSAPLHLYHLTKKTLKQLVLDSEFEVTECGTMPDQNKLIAGYSESLRFWLAARGRYPKPWQQHENRAQQGPASSYDQPDDRGESTSLLKMMEFNVLRLVSKTAAMAGLGTYLYLVAQRPE